MELEFTITGSQKVEATSDEVDRGRLQKGLFRHRQNVVAALVRGTHPVPVVVDPENGDTSIDFIGISGHQSSNRSTSNPDISIQLTECSCTAIINTLRWLETDSLEKS